MTDIGFLKCSLCNNNLSGFSYLGNCWAHLLDAFGWTGGARSSTPNLPDVKRLIGYLLLGAWESSAKFFLPSQTRQQRCPFWTTTWEQTTGRTTARPQTAPTMRVPFRAPSAVLPRTSSRTFTTPSASGPTWSGGSWEKGLSQKLEKVSTLLREKR